MDVKFTIEDVAENPAMYLPSRSIYCLKAYIDGINSQEMTDVWDYLDGFYDWLVETFQHDGKTVPDEVKLILHYVSTDPNDAFYRFFELLENFYEGDELLPFFRRIKENPYNYLPQVSIHTLYAYLWGVDMASQGLCNYTDLSEFEEWLQDYFENDSSWYKILLLYSQDEFGALQQFNTLYEEFATRPTHVSDGEAPSAR
jgi:hypothetical protein